MFEHVSSDLFVQLHQNVLLLIRRKLIYVGFAIDYIRSDLVGEALIHSIMFLDLLNNREILFNGLSIFSKRGDAISNLIDDISQHDDSEYLDEDNHKHFLWIFRGDISVSNCHDGGCAEIEGVEIENVLIGFIEVERSHPVVVGVELGGRKEDDGLDRKVVTMRCAIMKTVMIMSATFVWYSYCREKLMRRSD